ncbi:hypothetical protein [Arcticibacter sp.]|uniref:hypothetical protein n=1 Tax=Arcticibacter sp. TaxID=1872630 RepID=UPI00388F23B1
MFVKGAKRQDKVAIRLHRFCLSARLPFYRLVTRMPFSQLMPSFTQAPIRPALSPYQLPTNFASSSDFPEAGTKLVRSWYEVGALLT